LRYEYADLSRRPLTAGVLVDKTDRVIQEFFGPPSKRVGGSVGAD